MNTWRMWTAVAFMVVFCSGCGFFQKPYEVPKYEEVGAKETAFVLPMEGDIKKQNVFESAELLKDRKVSARRIPIEQKWVYKGRKWFLGIAPHTGEYLPMLKVYKVDRTPVTRVWTADPTTGTAKAKQALEAESKDSIGVSSGFTITAWVEEKNAHIFLYKYQGVELSQVIDSQIFNSVQTIYSEVCAKYDLKELRSKKQEITDLIREKVIPFYEGWGITIAEDCGLFGGLQYTEPEIQAAINAVFVAQQQEQKNIALNLAQEKENLRNMGIATNKATIVGLEAKAEAGRIKEISDAIKENAQSYIALQKLRLMQDFVDNAFYTVDNEGKRKPVWDGKLMSILNIGQGAGPGLMLQTPMSDIINK